MAKKRGTVSGYLNQYIEIMSSNNISLPAGGSDPNNEVYWATHAEVSQVKAYRNQEGFQSNIEFAYKFKVRYRNDKNLKNDMLLRWRGVYFTIFDYDPDVRYQDYVYFKGVQQNPGNLVITS